MANDALYSTSAENLPVLHQERQLAVYNCLKAYSSKLANRYLGVHFALNQPQNPEEIPQAAHSARELLRILPTHLAQIPQINASHCERYEMMLRKKDAAGNKFDMEKVRVAKFIRELQDKFENASHHRGELTKSEFEELFAQLEALLYTITSPFFEVEKTLTELLIKENPSKTDVRQLKSLLVKSKHVEYWFKNLDNPLWFPLLREAGLFASPPEMKKDEGVIYYSYWPQAEYLQKCARLFPEEIRDVVMNSTVKHNCTLFYQLAQIANSLPPAYAKRCLPAAKKWLDACGGELSLLPDELVKLAENFLQIGEDDAAFELGRLLTGMKLANQQEGIEDLAAIVDIKPEATSILSEWRYGKILKTLIPSLANRDIGRTIVLLCDNLDTAIRVENEINQITTTSYDQSWIWHPAIEDHSQNTDFPQLKDKMVTIARDLLLQFCRLGKAQQLEAFQILARYDYPLFRRMELFLMTEFPKENIPMIEQKVADPQGLDNDCLHHEFYRLLENTFGLCSEKTKKAYLDWVNRGQDNGN
jgi:hypothetical protein